MKLRLGSESQNEPFEFHLNLQPQMHVFSVSAFTNSVLSGVYSVMSFYIVGRNLSKSGFFFNVILSWDMFSWEDRECLKMYFHHCFLPAEPKGHEVVAKIKTEG